MASRERRPSGAWVAFLVGAVLVVVAVIGYAVYTTGQVRSTAVALNLAPAIRQLPSPVPGPDPTPLPTPLPRPTK